MRLTIAAVGRLGRGPEGSLVADYVARAEAAGRTLGLAPVEVVEIDERKARDAPSQGARLLAQTPAIAALLALDERGRAVSSTEFAELLRAMRDDGCPQAVFAIGGADGLEARLRARADRVIGFGPMVWPHRLARVMLAEQIYRAVSILAGTPYHRG